MTVIHDNARDDAIRQAQEKAKYNDTLILQKINQSHRIAFQDKYPGQCEHILRLLTERTQHVLDKRDGFDISNMSTWKASPSELAFLTESIYHMHLIRQDLLKNAKSE